MHLNHPKTFPQLHFYSMEKLFSTKSIPCAKKAGNRCSKQRKSEFNQKPGPIQSLLPHPTPPTSPSSEKLGSHSLCVLTDMFQEIYFHLKCLPKVGP